MRPNCAYYALFVNSDAKERRNTGFQRVTHTPQAVFGCVFIVCVQTINGVESFVDVNPTEIRYGLACTREMVDASMFDVVFEWQDKIRCGNLEDWVTSCFGHGIRDRWAVEMASIAAFDYIDMFVANYNDG